jgi:putative transposase
MTKPHHDTAVARTSLRTRRDLIWECVALRHQLAVLERCGTRRLRFRATDRLFWVFLSWWWPRWSAALTVIQPDTVLRWRRCGVFAIWKYRSRGRWRGGRPRIAPEIGHLIREMANANFLWGAPRVHGELLKLGIIVSQASVSRYMPLSPGGWRSQRWRTFVRNHAAAIVRSRAFDGRGLVDGIRSWSRVPKYPRAIFTGAALGGLLC